MTAALRIEHDVVPGPLKHCQVTGSDSLELVIDLGHQPLCDNLLTAEQLDQPEKTYPLRLMLCPDSGLAQLDYAVDGAEVYPPSYPYRAGISWPVVEHHRALCAEIRKRMDVPSTGYALVVDIGSNDGTLLKHFEDNGCRVLGVEPTDIAVIAREETGVPTLQEFFGNDAALRIRETHGQADVITCTNAFAHMATLGDVMRGICSLLAKHGFLVIEAHDLLAILQKHQFDSIYHEHLRTYSLKSLAALFPQYGLEIFAAERVDRYAGNLRVYVDWEGVRPVEPSVAELLAQEEAAGLFKTETWKAWRRRVLDQRDLFMTMLYRKRSQGRRIAGVSCPGRCATLINYYGIGPELIEYLGELPTSLKLGKYLPGKHLPVVSNSRFHEDPPDLLVLMAWHYADAIAERLRGEGYQGQIMAPLPEVCVA